MLHIKSIEIVGVAFAQLKDEHCRWLTDGLYCGEARREGSSYCDCHHARAYVSPGGRAFSVGGFLRFRAEKVDAAREGIARALEPPEKHAPISLDKFVRAAAAARHETPPAPIAVGVSRERTVVLGEYHAPRLTLQECETIERQYLRSIARQADDITGSFGMMTIRGHEYAASMVNHICYALGMSKDELLCNRKMKPLVESRQLAMFCVAIGALRLSLPYIARRIFGGFDHSTLIHARNKTARAIADDTLRPDLSAVLDRICTFDTVIAAAVRKARSAVDASAPT